ncbi:zona pellucida sperm-binding protein 4-like [Nerophis lumbriciformis]|uniref:zona pellucida sperm-binding protein 4-like n=1 Tax=Nerophis lumbriciformis TaxID=546530 RepID=UPI003BA8DB7C
MYSQWPRYDDVEVVKPVVVKPVHVKPVEELKPVVHKPVEVLQPVEVVKPVLKPVVEKLELGGLKPYSDPMRYDHSGQNQKVYDRKTKHHPSPHPRSCDVQLSARVPCGGRDISGTDCDAINCCYDGGHCYFGNTVTVQCTKDGQFIVVVSRECTLPNIDLDTISLLGDGQGCTHVDSNSAFAIYQFPVTACGSIITEEPGIIVYENRMTSSYEVGVGPLGAITRDSSYDLLFQCRYTSTSVETLIVEVQPISHPVSVSVWGPIHVALRLANGQCFAKGCVEEDVAYSSYYMEGDYPVTKILRDPVYVEVQLMERTDPKLVLSLGRCWTTISANPHSLPQWDILIDGCPNRDDRYLTSLVPIGPNSGLEFPTHYRRFIFKMFTFVDTSSLEPQNEQVYIHCSTSICDASAGYSCEPSCFRTKRQAEDDGQKTVESRPVVTVGPVVMVNRQD